MSGMLLDIWTRRVGKRPVGIWIAWLALAYQGGIALRQLVALLTGGGCCDQPPLARMIVVWPVMVGFAIALGRRRLFARMLGGISFSFLLYDSIGSLDIAGMILAPLGFFGLVACRRWYDERLHRMGW
jgi:hypothetical protein